MQGHPAPRRKAGQGIAAPITAGSPDGSGYRNDADTTENLVAGTVSAKWSKGTGGPAGDEVQNLVALPLLAKGNSSHDDSKETYVAHTLRGEGFDASEDGTGRGIPLAFDWYASESQSMPTMEGLSPPLKTTMQPAIAEEPYTLAVRGRGDGHDLEYRQDGTANAVLTPSGGRAGIGVGAVAIPFDTTQMTSPKNGSNPQDGDPMHALSAQAHPPAIAGAAVRRLMPHECARLQGFDDDRCRIPWKGRPAEKCPDGPQYKAYGNSMAIPFMRWIGMRIDLIERLAREGKIR